jgi:hypothetical protein
LISFRARWRKLRPFFEQDTKNGLLFFDGGWNDPRNASKLVLMLTEIRLKKRFSFSIIDESGSIAALSFRGASQARAREAFGEILAHMPFRSLARLRLILPLHRIDPDIALDARHDCPNRKRPASDSCPSRLKLYMIMPTNISSRDAELIRKKAAKDMDAGAIGCRGRR